MLREDFATFREVHTRHRPVLDPSVFSQRRRLLACQRLSLCALPETQAKAIPVFVDKLDAGRLESARDNVKGGSGGLAGLLRRSQVLADSRS